MIYYFICSSIIIDGNRVKYSGKLRMLISIRWGIKVDNIKILNEIYVKINKKKKELIQALKEKGISYRWGYYSQHSVKINEEWITEEYPIPVITIDHISDLGIDIPHIFLEIAITREQALKFDYHKLESYPFEVYGMENYLNDFYNTSLSFTEIKDRIQKSSEVSIGISVFFSVDEPASGICHKVMEIQKYFA